MTTPIRDNEASAATDCYVDVTGDADRRTGGERWVRTVDSRHWISVLHRLTGFGHMEWETAINIVADVPNPTWKDRDCLIIAGDRREELEGVHPNDWRQWYTDRIDGNRTSFEAVLDAISVAT
jgi:hypothetical protein